MLYDATQYREAYFLSAPNMADLPGAHAHLLRPYMLALQRRVFVQTSPQKSYNISS